MSRQVALNANAAADRVEAKQQHDEGNVFFEKCIGEHCRSNVERRTLGGGLHHTVRRPVGFDGTVVREEIVT